jgi:hypothetical protein
MGSTGRIKEILGGAERCRRVRLKTSPPSVNQFSTQCEILNISKPYGSPWSVAEVTSIFCKYYIFILIVYY